MSSEHEREKDPGTRPVVDPKRYRVEIVAANRVSVAPNFPGENSNESLTLSINIPTTLTKRRYSAAVVEGTSCRVRLWFGSVQTMTDDLTGATAVTAGPYTAGGGPWVFTPPDAHYDSSEAYYATAVQVFSEVDGSLCDYNAESYTVAPGQRGVPAGEGRIIDVSLLFEPGYVTPSVGWDFEDPDPPVSGEYDALTWIVALDGGATEVPYDPAEPMITIDAGPLPGAIGNEQLEIDGSKPRVGVIVKVRRKVGQEMPIAMTSCQLFEAVSEGFGTFVGFGTPNPS